MYLLSVVIPTKNRYEYLKECLKSLADLNSDKIEIIVQDNTLQNEEIISFIEALDSKHIKYFHSTAELSQTGNSDLAVSHVTGEYCTYIGDDDALCRSAIDAAEYMKKNHILACVNDVATYHWPDVVFEHEKKPALSFDNRECTVRMLDSKKVMDDFLSWGCQDIKYLPRIYHAIIHRSVLEKIKEKTGSYFPGPSPDMANAVSALLLMKRYAYISLPLILSGYSYKSAGGMGLRGAHSGSLSAVKQLPANAEAEWSPRIPKVWLGYTVWPESAEKAFIRMDQEAYISRINYHAMYAKIFLKYPDYRMMVLKNIKGISGFFHFVFECFRFMFRWFGERNDSQRRKKSGRQYIIKENISLLQACKTVDKCYEQRKKNIGE
ncbi:MAG: glycosyltransferase family 2 protein [Oscillospiraceae bacterium]|nr:glycosyltransferase family 2 protein [Oscillospiraceae bacterium]